MMVGVTLKILLHGLGIGERSNTLRQGQDHLGPLAGL